MKKYISIILVAVLVVTAIGCQKQSAGKTRITYYPTLTLSGDSYVLLTVGDSFTDPGFKAEMNGEDVTDQIVVNTNLDNNTPGLYPVVYSIVNSDGISASATRYVIVHKATDKISGTYTTDAASYRDTGSAQTAMGGAYQVLIYPSENDDEYVVSDLLGGWYGQRVGYGSNYELVGTIQATGGILSLVDSYLIGWGDAALGFTGTYTDGTLVWDVIYAYDTWTFHIKVDKN